MAQPLWGGVGPLVAVHSLQDRLSHDPTMTGGGRDIILFRGTGTGQLFIFYTRFGSYSVQVSRDLYSSSQVVCNGPNVWNAMEDSCK